MPEAGRYPADLGAEVVKLASSARPEPVRGTGPHKDGIIAPGRSLSYHAINAGKHSINVNMKHPRGRQGELDLARLADVVIESFAPGEAESLRIS